jgi:hypothetical protein
VDQAESDRPVAAQHSCDGLRSRAAPGGAVRRLQQPQLLRRHLGVGRRRVGGATALGIAREGQRANHGLRRSPVTCTISVR